MEYLHENDIVHRDMHTDSHQLIEEPEGHRGHGVAFFHMCSLFHAYCVRHVFPLFVDTVRLLYLWG